MATLGRIESRNERIPTFVIECKDRPVLRKSRMLFLR